MTIEEFKFVIVEEYDVDDCWNQLFSAPNSSEARLRAKHVLRDKREDSYNPETFRLVFADIR